MTYLFLASIGPIQSFIASARRTRDLWFGSTLLSELSKTAARTIEEKTGDLNSLIFPAPRQKEDLKPNSAIKVANKILACIEYDSEELGKLIYAELQQQLDTIRDYLYRDIKDAIDNARKGANAQAENWLSKSNHDIFDQSALEAQLADLVEYSWVALPLDSPEAYARTRDDLEALLAARKNTRTFQPVGWGSKQHKSSIDGQLESVIPDAFYPQRKAGKYEPAIYVRQLYDIFHAGPSEHLSGVDLLKRRGRFQSDKQKAKEQEDFVSTSHLAATPYLDRLRALAQDTKPEYQDALKRAKELWKVYITQVAKITGQEEPVFEKIPPGRHDLSHPILEQYDGALLFAERLIEDAVNNETLNTAMEHLKHFSDYINDVFKVTLQPGTYYAILQADGDGMGAAIDYQAEQGEPAHRDISRKLDEFAESTKKSVEEENQGTLVYAGGDDVLAFLPIHNALRCAQALRKNFSKYLGDFKYKVKKTDKDYRSPTLSVGIAIVHHLSLLDEALNHVRRAEKMAKHVDEDKNALAIIVSKRSGEEYAIAGHWGDLDAYMELLISYFRSGYIPGGTAYELRATTRQLKGFASTEETSKLSEAIKANARRTLRRKLGVPESKRHDQTEAILQKLEQRTGILPQDDLKSALKEQTATSSQAEEKPVQVVDIAEFINELIIAEELADAYNLAEPLVKEGVAV
jgi:CRISPR-associated protein Cmr2